MLPLTRFWAERIPNALQLMTLSRFRHAHSASAEPLRGRYLLRIRQTVTVCDLPGPFSPHT
jgi:hypothetical protein